MQTCKFVNAFKSFMCVNNNKHKKHVQMHTRTLNKGRPRVIHTNRY